MATPQLVSDAFEEQQKGRTISGAYNKNRVAVTNRQKPANDNYRGSSRSVVVSSGRSRQGTVVANDNPAPWLIAKVREIENNIDDFDFDELEEFLELYGGQIGEKARGLIGKALLIRKYYKVTLLNISIIGWGITLWLIQFKLALISLAAFGIVGALDAISQNAAGKFVIGASTIVYETFGDSINAIFGASINFDPESLLHVTILLPFLIGLATLLAMVFLYQITFVNYFFGKGTELKLNAFIFAIFGYFVPILNVFPWFIFWLLAVWRYPK